MADRLQVTGNNSSQINPYEDEPYVWDGQSRPNVNDYINPWIHDASQTMYKSTLSGYNKMWNARVTYAKNQLSAALAQYDNDMAMWNEFDERNYTSQLSQAQRYDDAGFNMGYMYSNVDSGNSAVGYDQSDSSFDPSENVGDETIAVKTIASAVLTCVNVVAGLVSIGVTLKELPKKLAIMQSQKHLLDAQQVKETYLGEYHGVVYEVEQWIKSHDIDGNAVSDISKSLAFTLKQVQAQEGLERIQDWQNFNKFGEELYEIQSTPSATQEYNKLIMDSNLPEWAKMVLMVLGGAFSNASQNFKINKRLN